MDILIDNKNISTYFGIKVLDYTGVFDFPAEREDERTWVDKSGVDRNLANIRYDAKEFVLQLYCKASNEGAAYDLVNTLVDYMFQKGVFVLSVRDMVKNIRKCFLCERSSTIVSSINIREQNSIYYFKLGLKDINPNALKFYNTISGLATTINYTKGQTADIYWGNGDRALVSNSGNYTKTGYPANGLVDIIIDVDANASVIIPLVANFSGTPLTGAKALQVQFTDTSNGGAELWAWDFGDGSTSSLQNPSHTYQNEGTYTVSLQIFNAAKGSDIETKINYVTVRTSRILANDSGDFILANDSGDFILKN